MVNYAVICAAGLGSRLGLNLPKCLVEIGNLRVIDYLLEALSDIPNIRVVVGFKEKEVIDYVSNIRRDVVFVRNPNYMNTTNAYSLHLGSRDINEPFINVDGDMIVKREDIKKFLEYSEGTGGNVIGVASATTEDAVFVDFDGTHVTRFAREPISEFEWTGIAYLRNIKISKHGRYVYEELKANLPILGRMIDCFEIDTPADLDYALSHFETNSL